ncbi:S9 family peptidase [Flavobacterium sp. SM2513]|uniref:S9 family peptidase n=1 Tax=Flavobacterium sp. SM2513 TaxID=3424766 RepID=UPI003D7F69D0
MKQSNYLTWSIYGRFCLLFAFIINVATTDFCSAQDSAKRNLTQADYNLWHNLQLEAISDDGDWVSYRHYYSETDTLFVQNRKSKKVLSFSKVLSGFFKKDYYVCGTPDGLLHIVSLKTGKVKVLKGVQQFNVYDAFIATAQQIENEKALILFDYEGKEMFRALQLSEYKVSPDENYVGVLQRKLSLTTFSLVSTKGFVVTELLKQPIEKGLFSLIAWNSESTAVAFYDTLGSDSTIHYYHLGRRELHTFDSSFAGFPPSMHFYVRAELNLSADGNRVFFKIRQKPELNVVRPPNGVQVWNANAPEIYPSFIATEGYTQNSRCAMWEPKNQRFMEITDTAFPVGGSGGNSTVALVYNPLTLSAADKFTQDTEMYITTLATGQRRLLAKEIIGGSTNAFISPTGKYVSYLEKGQWKVYFVDTGLTTVVTKNIAVSFSSESLTEEGENSYGNPGWSVNDSYILLYDEFDIWRIKPDGSSSERLTRGREEGIKYRILAQKNKGQTKTNDGRITTVGTFDLDATLLLRSRSVSNDYNGFAVWRPGNRLQTICYVPKALSGIAQSENGTFVWSEEDVSQPPTLMVRKGTSEAQVMHKSNKHQERFKWTKSELLDYQNSDGIPLQGILYYPAGYVSGKLYPMVVHIYQKQSHLLHKYTLPTLNNSDGFNTTNLTAKGYFVLLPDITYTVGAIGFSAVDCVTAAVRKALENTSIDSRNVGLIGHSFGGTQTDFIITQSTLFKCAVAGAATTDFISSHLSVTPNYQIPNFYKIERGQARMMVSPFENWERYLKNSALYYAANVTTPLLSWTGLQDGQVDYTQSFEFYLALRRLKKEHTMLVYPDVEHDMSGMKEAVDLTQKIEDWLDYYLKNSAKPSWL